jgi:hypothetical protein
MPSLFASKLFNCIFDRIIGIFVCHNSFAIYAEYVLDRDENQLYSKVAVSAPILTTTIS